MVREQQSYPTHNSGLFLPYDSDKQVKFSEVVYEDETQHAYVTEHKVRMKNGAHYKVSEMLPKHCQVDVVNLRTPAWTTSHNRGHERFIAGKLSEIGMVNICISPQQNVTKIGNMTKSSHDYIEIARHLAGSRDLDPNRAVVNGSSRGSMYAKAVTHLAPEHNFSIEYEEGAGGALPKGLRLSKVPEAACKLVREPGRLLQIVMRNPRETAQMLIDTPARNIGEATQQLKEFSALTGGETAEHTSNMPPDTFAVETQFTHDGLGDGKEWPGLFEPYNGVYLHVVPGTHMDCVSPRMIDTTVSRLQYVRDGLVSGAVGSQALHNMIAVGNPLFQDTRPFSHLRRAS